MHTDINKTEQNSLDLIREHFKPDAQFPVQSNSLIAREMLPHLQKAAEIIYECKSDELSTYFSVIIGAVRQVATGEIPRINCAVNEDIKLFKSKVLELISSYQQLTCYEDVIRMRNRLDKTRELSFDVLNKISLQLVDYSTR